MAGQELAPGGEGTFGAPVRSAAEDANAGILNKPYQMISHKEVTTPTVVHNTSDPTGEDSTNLHIALSSLAEPLGRAAEGHQKGWDDQQKLEAEARQGFQLGIEEVSRNRKRGDWLEALAGQDVSFRTAQLQAIRNNFDQIQVEDLTLADTYAADTPEQFLQRKQELLPKYLEPFKDDIEATAMIRDQYNKNTKTLAREHMKNHIAYVAQEVNDNRRKSFLIKASGWNELAQNVSGDGQSALDHNKDIRDSLLWTDSMKGEISKEGHNSALTDAIEISMAEGNLGLYRAALKNGILEELNHKDRMKVNNAVHSFEAEQKVAQKSFRDDLKAAGEDGDEETAGQLYAQRQIEISKGNTGTATNKRLRSEANIAYNGIQKKVRKQGLKDSIAEMSLSDVIAIDGGNTSGIALASTHKSTGNTNAYKQARTDIDKFSVGEVGGMQQRHEIAAAGSGQITPGTWESAKHGMFEVTDSMKYNAKTQTYMNLNLFWQGAEGYMLEEDDDKAAGMLKQVMKKTSGMWGILEYEDGKGALDGVNGNKSKVNPQNQIVGMREKFRELLPNMGMKQAALSAFTGNVTEEQYKNTYNNLGKSYDSLTESEKITWRSAVGKRMKEQLQEAKTQEKQTIEQARDSHENESVVAQYMDLVDSLEGQEPIDNETALIMLNVEKVFDPGTPEADKIAMMKEALKGIGHADKARKERAKIQDKQSRILQAAETIGKATTGGTNNIAALGSLQINETNEIKESGKIANSVQILSNLSDSFMADKLEVFNKDGSMNAEGALVAMADKHIGKAWVEKDFKKNGKNPLVEQFVANFLENPGNQVVKGAENELTPEAQDTWTVLNEMAKYPEKLDENLSGEMRLKLDIYQNGVRQGKTMMEINKDWSKYNSVGASTMPLEVTKGSDKLTGLDAAFAIIDGSTKEYGEQVRFKHMIMNDDSVQREFLRQYQIATHMGRSQNDSVGYAMKSLTANTTMLNGHVIYTNELNNIKVPGGTIDLESALNGSESFRRKVQEQVKGKLEGKDIEFNQVAIREAVWDGSALRIVFHGSNGEYNDMILDKNQIDKIAKESHSDMAAKLYTKQMYDKTHKGIYEDEMLKRFRGG